MVSPFVLYPLSVWLSHHAINSLQFKKKLNGDNVYGCYFTLVLYTVVKFLN